MAKPTRIAISGNPNPAPKVDPVIHDIGARRMMERLGSGNPLFGPVCMELLTLQAYGIELTVGIVDKAIDKVAARHAPRVPQQETATPSAKLPMQRKPTARFGQVPVDGEVVYYMRIGNRVKMGTSTNLRKRLAVINPEELLAYEAGGCDVERHRHVQFKHLRTHGEWFRYEGSLMDHVAILKKELAQ